MTVDTTTTFRIMNNNLASLSSATKTYSSEVSGFPGTNLFDQRRTKVWKPNGRFEITSSTLNIHINDGSVKAVALTAGEYTYATLAAHMQTQLNASSSGWTVTYSTTTYKFTLANSSSVSLLISTTTNAAWTTLGFTGSTDLTGTSFSSDTQRNHYPCEYVQIDFGARTQIEFLGLIGDLGSDFTVSSAGTVTIEANNIDVWTSPPLSTTATVTDDGAFKFIIDVDSNYRFWRIKITDPTNPLGNSGLQLGYMYLGPYNVLTSRNLSSGFSHTINDPSNISESENGTVYADSKTKYTSFDGMNVGFLTPANKDILERLYADVGKTTPFFISIDPTLLISDTIEKLTKYVTFEGGISFQQVFVNKFRASFKLREAV